MGSKCHKILGVGATPNGTSRPVRMTIQLLSQIAGLLYGEAVTRAVSSSDSQAQEAEVGNSYSIDAHGPAFENTDLTGRRTRAGKARLLSIKTQRLFRDLGEKQWVSIFGRWVSPAQRAFCFLARISGLHTATALPASAGTRMFRLVRSCGSSRVRSLRAIEAADAKANS